MSADLPPARTALLCRGRVLSRCVTAVFANILENASLGVRFAIALRTLLTAGRATGVGGFRRRLCLAGRQTHKCSRAQKRENDFFHRDHSG